MTKAIFLLYDNVSTISISKHLWPVTIAVTGITTHACANEQTAYPIHITAQTIDDALFLLASQTSVSIAFQPSKQKPCQTQHLEGRFTIDEALTALLLNCHYEYDKVQSTYIIKEKIQNIVNTDNTKSSEKTIRPHIEEVWVEGLRLSQTPSSNNHLQLTQHDIEQYGLDTLQALSKIAPGLSVSHQQGNTLPYLRGVGSNDAGDLSDPHVSTYFNGSYIARTHVLNTALHDIKTISVHPGPQIATGFRSSIGGEINIQPETPHAGKKNARINLKAGTYNLQHATFMINTPLLTQQTLRVSGLVQQEDSYYQDIGPNGFSSSEIPGFNDNYNLRIQWLAPRWEEWELLFSHEIFHVGGTGTASSNLSQYLQSANTLQNPNTISPAFSSYSPSSLPMVNSISSKDARVVYYLTNASYRHNTTHDYAIKLRRRYVNTDINLSLGKKILRQDEEEWYNDGITIQQHILSEPLEQFDRTTISKHYDTYWLDLSLQHQFETLLYKAKFSHFDERVTSFRGSIDDRGDDFLGEQNATEYQHSFSSFLSEWSLPIKEKNHLALSFRLNYHKKIREGIIISATGNDWPSLRLGTEGFQWQTQRNILHANDFDDPSELTSNGIPVLNGSDDDLSIITQRELWEAYRDGIAQFGNNDEVESYTVNLNYENVGFHVSNQTGDISQFDIDSQIQFTRDINPHHKAYAIVSESSSAPGFNEDIYENYATRYQSENALHAEFGWIFSDETFSAKFTAYHTQYDDKILLTKISRSVLQNTIQIPPPNSFNAQDSALNMRFNAAKAISQGLDISGEFLFFDNWKINLRMALLDAYIQEGQLLDNRLAAFSPFPNTDLLRFNTPHTNTPIPGTNTHYTHPEWANPYNWIHHPELQTYRPGIDLNNDGQASHYFGVDCRLNAGCFSTPTTPPDIEPPLRNLKGNKLPRSPLYSANISLETAFPLKNIVLRPAISLSYRSDYFLTIFNGRGLEPTPFITPDGKTEYDIAPSLFDKVDSHITVDLHVTFDIPSYNTQVTLSGENVTNEHTLSDVSISPWNYTAWYDSPRQWSIHVSVEL